MNFRHFIALLLLFASPSAHAWPPTFGAEFTFTNPVVLTDGKPYDVGSPSSYLARDTMTAWIEAKCKVSEKCRVEPSYDKYDNEVYRVVYNDGWWFQIAVDPGVVEITTKATTIAELEQLQTRIQEDIFGIAEKVGIFPHETAGGGHIHIGLHSGFESDADLFRNFLVDQANHPGLSNGIFSNSSPNSPTLAELPLARRMAFAQVIQDFDKRAFHGIRNLAARVQNEVYTWTTRFSPPWKYQATNVSRVVSDEFNQSERTVEMRAHRPQRSAEEFVKQVKLYEARLAYLKKLKARLPILNIEGTVPTQEAVDQFHRYVTEAGLPWQDYKELLPPRAVGIVPTAGRTYPKLALPEVVKPGLVACLRENMRSLLSTRAGPSTR